MNATELVKERAGLLARVEQINAALALLRDPARPVRIQTSRNLRNTGPAYVKSNGSETSWEYVKIYSDATLTKAADGGDHSGFITAEDAARLITDGSDDEVYSLTPVES